MLLFLINLFVLFFLFAKAYIHNEPLKSSTENFFDGINSLLIAVKSGTTSDAILRVKKTSTKVFLFSFFCLLVIFSISPQGRGLSKLIVPVSGIFLLSILTFICIEWFTNHKKSIRENFLSVPMLSLIFSPTICYLLIEILVTSNIKFPNELKMFITIIIDLVTEKFWVSILFQLLWAFFIITLIYIGFSVVLFPIYVFIFIIIFLFIRFLRTIEKHINNKIKLVDLVVGLSCFVIEIILLIRT